MDQWIETAAGFRIPAQVAQLPKAELVARVYGIICGEYGCPGCGRIYEEKDYPSSVCPDCRTPLPHVCVNKTCANVVEPVRVETQSGGVVYYSPPLDCKECQKYTGRAQRAAYMESITPRHIHANLGAAYYWQRAGRGVLDEALKGWFLDERCGALSRVHMLYVWGPAGSGKSVGVMYHATINHLSLKVEGLFYVSEDTLLQANAERYADIRDVKDRAMSLFDKCQRTPLLIVDDFGARESYRPAQAEMYSRVLGQRLRTGAATIVIGSKRPVDGSPFSFVPGQLSGAFRGSGRSVWVEAG